MSHFQYQRAYRRNLPHIQPPGATFFMTFRLAGSLPQTVVRQWNRERQWLAHAYEANKLLGREGEFWAHESYDHWIRDRVGRPSQLLGRLCGVTVATREVRAGRDQFRRRLVGQPWDDGGL